MGSASFCSQRSEAKLLLLTAQNEVRAAFAELSSALGYQEPRELQLVEEPLPDRLKPDVRQYVEPALRQRPELAAVRPQREADLRFAKAEKSLRFPTISLVGGAGLVPGHDDRLRNRYGALGLNISIPVFNGPLYSATPRGAPRRTSAPRPPNDRCATRRTASLATSPSPG
jgi:outer membrane protein